MRLVLARHGETRWNADGRFQGRSASPLSALGRRQARRLARACRRYAPTALYTSPLPRARETAAYLADALGLEAHPLEALQEAHLGELEGLTAQEVRARYPEVAAAWRRDPGAVTLPGGGESLGQLQERVWGAVQGLGARHGDETVVAVSHNFAIRAVVCRVLGLPLSRFRTLQVDLASLTVVEVEGDGGRLLLLNDRCHLEGPSAFSSQPSGGGGQGQPRPASGG